MLEEHLSDEDLIDVVHYYSDYRIQGKYFPLMFESPLIMEPLKLIYILSCNKNFNPEDMQLVKKVFQENFRFFSEPEPEPEQYESNSNLSNNRKIKLFLSVLFFSLMLLSGIGCIYSSVAIPFAIFFGMGLILCTCFISLKRDPVEIIPRFDEIYESCKSELNTLKENLDILRNIFAEKYKIKMTNVDSVVITLAEPVEDTPTRKKSVTFAPKLNKLNLFNIESPESRSRANSYENNGNFRPTL